MVQGTTGCIKFALSHRLFKKRKKKTPNPRMAKAKAKEKDLGWQNHMFIALRL